MAMFLPSRLSESANNTICHLQEAGRLCKLAALKETTLGDLQANIRASLDLRRTSLGSGLLPPSAGPIQALDHDPGNSPQLSMPTPMSTPVVCTPRQVRSHFYDLVTALIESQASCWGDDPRSPNVSTRKSSFVLASEMISQGLIPNSRQHSTTKHIRDLLARALNRGNPSPLQQSFLCANPHPSTAGPIDQVQLNPPEQGRLPNPSAEVLCLTP